LASPLNMVAALSIDYEYILTEFCSEGSAADAERLSEELPYVWADAYKQMSPHAANIWRIKRDVSSIFLIPPPSWYQEAN
jgi:hypothetical protein